MREYTEQEIRVNPWRERNYCSRIGLMLFCTIVISLIFQGWIVVLYATGSNEAISLSTVLSIMLVGHYVLVIPVCYAMTMDIPRAPLGNETVSAGRFVKWSAASCAIGLIGSVIGLKVHEFVYALFGKAAIDPINSTLDNMNPWIAFICVCVIAPIMEELVFRYFILGSLSRYGEKLALCTSALLFGLFHGNFSQFFYTFAIALILGYAYLRTGKLRWSILLHAAFNIYGSLASLFFTENEIFQIIWGYFMLAFAIYGIVVLIQNAKRVTLSNEGVQISNGTCWGSPGMVLALIGCIFIFISNYAL